MRAMGRLRRDFKLMMRIYNLRGVHHKKRDGHMTAPFKSFVLVLFDHHLLRQSHSVCNQRIRVNASLEV